MIPRFGGNVFVRVAVVAVAIVLIAATAPAQVADRRSMSTGDAVPGGVVDVTATVEITRRSTLQSYSWTQVGGVEAMLSGTGTQTVTAALGTASDYTAYLIHVLMEPPITEEQLPPNVPLPEGEFPAGLQDRFQVVGINPFALEHAEAVALEVEVVTTSGTYHAETHVLTHLPWKVSTGLLNVPINAPVLLHGKDQASYSWTLSAPSGSGAMLNDPSSQNPTFTPDVARSLHRRGRPGGHEGARQPCRFTPAPGSASSSDRTRTTARSPTLRAWGATTTIPLRTPLPSGRRPATPRSSAARSTPAPTTVKTALPATWSGLIPAPTTTASTRPTTTRRSLTPD